MVWKILDILASICRILLWAALIVSIAMYRTFDDEPIALILVIVCCVGNIASSLDYFMSRYY